MWSLHGVFLHLAALRRSAWIKTNQMSGSWAALLAQALTGRPLLVRQGYLLSNRFRKNGHSARAWLARALEDLAHGRADTIVVTSAEAERKLSTDRRIASKVRRLPTYVDLTVFKPKSEYDFSAPIVFVGRLEPQKNLINLAKACREIGVALHLYGEGSLEEDLRKIGRGPGSPIELKGIQSNDELARLLRGYSIFAIPSLHEGLPKALIEAMASGLICVGADIPGVRDLITPDHSGYLIHGSDPEAIAGALTRAIAEARVDLGQNARRFVESTFALPAYAMNEAALYHSGEQTASATASGASTNVIKITVPENL